MMVEVDFARALRVAGLGAPAGPSAVTMQVAQALDQYLVTNGCNGCESWGGLRTAAFAFKIAVLSDPALSSLGPGLSAATPLALTAFGPAMNAALSSVLGATRQSESVPCTDDAGNCLGNRATPTVSSEIATTAPATMQRVRTLFSQKGMLPQLDIINMVEKEVGELLSRLRSLAPASAQPTKTSPEPAATPATKPAPLEKASPLVKVGVLVAVPVIIAGLWYIAYKMPVE